MKRQKAVRKGRKRYVNKLCESFLNKETKVRIMDASSASNSDSSAANATIRSTTSAVGAIIKSSDVYFYGVDVIALLAISVCGGFFLQVPRNLLKPRIKNKPRNNSHLKIYRIDVVQFRFNDIG